MITHVLIGLCLFFSILNFLGVLFLSNSLFRILVPKPDVELIEPKNQQEKGLVDPKNSGTYDPRFKA